MTPEGLLESHRLSVECPLLIRNLTACCRDLADLNGVTEKRGIRPHASVELPWLVHGRLSGNCLVFVNACRRTDLGRTHPNIAAIHEPDINMVT